MFLTGKKNDPEIVVNSQTLETALDPSDKRSSIERVACYLRSDIEEYCSNSSSFNS